MAPKTKLTARSQSRRLHFRPLEDKAVPRWTPQRAWSTRTCAARRTYTFPERRPASSLASPAQITTHEIVGTEGSSFIARGGVGAGPRVPRGADHRQSGWVVVGDDVQRCAADTRVAPGDRSPCGFVRQPAVTRESQGESLCTRRRPQDMMCRVSARAAMMPAAPGPGSRSCWGAYVA